MSTPSPSDEELVLAIPHDPDAFTAFYRRHARDVLGTLVRRTGDAELAADLTAEVFATVLLQAKRYRPDRGNAQGWLYAIARHKQLDAHRRGVAETAACHRLGLRRVAVLDEDLEAIHAAGSEIVTTLELLPDDQRSAIRGRVLDDLSYEELAGRLGVSQPAARQRVARGLAVMRGRIGKR